jgi:hypothetical protein
MPSLIVPYGTLNFVEEGKRWPPEDLTCWADWAGPVERAAVVPEGRDLVTWATEEVTDFYGDDWFARNAERRAFARHVIPLRLAALEPDRPRASH